MINVKKKERKACGSERYFCQIFFVFVGRNDPRVWTFFFFGQQQEQGKNDSFLEGALLSRRRLNENNAYYILHVFVAPGKENKRDRKRKKKNKKKEEKRPHLCALQRCI